eukprot:gnl/TRDRNA2_/TRDRNA2_60866_c0_seq1.p1 gnl/TRDRNA2_/TRDRNA2_60866_c0~~gnl/TRDRNA2_/TRDRNA2_60866_c0_seq1.p1  ORF type:complete len:586 (-),score=76.86 gnl/TRDRNA2_/TRDRNA2_60866_c0_seq1:258-2015(-)
MSHSGNGAWTTKGDRFGAQAKGRTPDALGPGVYIQHKAYAEQESYAPFASTAIRATSQPTAHMLANASPPPGAYDPVLPPKGHYESGLPKKSVAFSTSGARLSKQYIQDTPGPGTYPLKGMQVPMDLHRTMGEPQTKAKGHIMRSSSAPSIPRGHQTHGYEEAGDGRLIRQGPKDGQIWLTGAVGDNAGPNHYSPNDEVVKPRAVGGKILGFKMKGVAGQQLSETPGPGAYTSAELRIEAPRGPNIPCSAFASESSRQKSKYELERIRAQPGPGTYGLGDRIKRSDLREQRADLQFFGSTVERFKSAAADKQPGPGHYHDGGRRAPIAGTVFSTDSRFKVPKSYGAAATPGPGAYTPSPGDRGEPETTGPMGTFSILGASGGLAFGGMSKRFLPETLDQDFPGPGSYPLNGEDESDSSPRGKGDNRRRALRRRQSAPSSFFKSGTSRDDTLKRAVKDGQSKPPPGAYNPVLPKDTTAVVRLHSKGEGFLGSEPRFRDQSSRYPRPEPGTYDAPIASELTAGKIAGTFNRCMTDSAPARGRPKNIGFAGSAERFKYKADTNKPGPGAYNTEPNWVTKTFNCTYGDP